MTTPNRLLFDLDENGQPLMNCMTIIAGKDASETGRVLVGHNEDDGGHNVVHHTIVPPADWPEGTFLPAEDGCARIPQAEHTLGYYWVEFRGDNIGLSNADMFYNDHGVVIVTNSMGTSRETKEECTGLRDGGMAFNLRRILAERATSARDGIKLLMELVDTWGYAPSGRAYTLADKNEAFMFQLVRGRHYVGARVPDDHIVVMPNYYTFHTLHDCPEMYYSKDIVEYAIEKGWYVPAVEGDYSDFDFALAYQDPKEHMGLRNVLRQKHGQRIALGRDWDVEKEGLPFSIPASRKMNVRLIADILSTHYEGTPDRCEWYGPGRSPHDTPNIRNICTGTTLECAIFDIADEIELTTAYTAFGRPCEQPFVPIHPMMGLPTNLEKTVDGIARMEGHLRPEPTALHSDEDGWHRLRRAESRIEMVYDDALPTVQTCLAKLFDEGVKQNERMLQVVRGMMAMGKAAEARSALILSDEAFLDHAVNGVESVSLRQAEIEAVPELSLSAMPSEIELAFCLDTEPTEQDMIFGLAHTDTRQKYAHVIPSSLKALGENRYSVCFAVEPFESYLRFSGTYDFILGGMCTDSKAFEGLISVAFKD